MITGILGPEGSGKTCFMTYLALRHVALKGKLQTFPGYTVTDGRGKQLSQPLEIEDWVTMPPELRDTLICIDEVQNFFNSLKHMQTMNYLFTNLAAQRRHRGLGIIYTVQDWGWLDNRIRWLTHTLATCYDLYWSPWGKEQGLKRGELIAVTFYDVKGFNTGRPWTQSPPFNLKAKPIWNCYDSYCDVDIWSGMSKIDLKKPKFTIDLTGMQEEEKAAPASPTEPLTLATPDIDTEMLTELSNTPGVKPATLRKLAKRLHSG